MPIYTRSIETTCGWIAEHTGRSCDSAHTGGGDGVWFGAGDAVVAERILEALHGRRARLRTLYEQRPDTGIENWPARHGWHYGWCSDRNPADAVMP
ncbi:hypothetical protein [Nocardia rhamnosiphila]|uniref:hypothetical protein n=1 Tax=Nocardia rhamnosiphila TaxID=426716 RepID=UPI0004C2F04E|nr:hypothetical protein [Nocardia rhamnosiphila]